MRCISFLLLLLAPTNSQAAFLAVWDREGTNSAFVTVLDAHNSSYREIAGNPPPDFTAHAVYLALILAYAAILTRRLPRSRVYAARAARAMSRTRATIARKPFERWADK